LLIENEREKIIALFPFLRTKLAVFHAICENNNTPFMNKSAITRKLKNLNITDADLGIGAVYEGIISIYYYQYLYDYYYYYYYYYFR